MYNTTYKVPQVSTKKIDWIIVCVWFAATVGMCAAFAKAVDGLNYKAPAKHVVIKHSKG